MATCRGKWLMGCCRAPEPRRPGSRHPHAPNIYIPSKAGGNPGTRAPSPPTPSSCPRKPRSPGSSPLLSPEPPHLPQSPGVPAPRPPENPGVRLPPPGSGAGPAGSSRLNPPRLWADLDAWVRWLASCPHPPNLDIRLGTLGSLPSPPHPHQPTQTPGFVGWPPPSPNWFLHIHSGDATFCPSPP